MDERLIDHVTGEFNTTAEELQATEFRRPKTPGEWQRMAEEPRVPDYARLIEAVVPLLVTFEGLTRPGDRAALSAKLTTDALGILRTFAHAASIVAVRWNDLRLVGQGLTALAILGGTDDVRDLTFYLSTLYHSGVKLGVDVAALFNEKAALSPSVDLQVAMGTFPSRPSGSRDIRAFGLQETIARGGFNFRSV